MPAGREPAGRAQAPRERAPRTSALASMHAVAALCCAFSAVRPMTPESPVLLNTGLAVALSTAAAGLWLARAVPVWAVHALVLSGTAVTSSVIAVSATAQGSTATAMAYTWLTLFSAYYLSRRAARTVTLLNAVAYAAALAWNPYPGAATAWFVICATSLFGGERLSGLLAQLREDARTDRLTGALNRSGLELAAHRRLAEADRTGSPLAVAVLDLDHFKHVNDRQGHAAGDRVLVELVAGWRAELREGDVLARSGGDEFVLLLGDTGAREAREVLRRLRRAAISPWSYGLAVRRPGEDLDACLARADRELYRAKAERDVVVDPAAVPLPRSSPDVPVVGDVVA